MNYKMIRYILGWILIFEALFMIVPIITAAVYMERAVLSFIAGALICAAAGGLMIFKKPKNTSLYSRDGYVIVSASWIIMSLFGAFPFVISGCIPDYIDALFETVSGFTTTGASILSEVESLPKSILMWRSFMHWVGGMGVLVFIMAFLPLSGGRNMHIMKAESSGPSVSKLVPRVKTTALILYAIYFVLTFIEFLLLIAGKMSVFDALNTAFSTAGTGGFGIKNNSLGGYSPYIQTIVIIFMILFSISFGSYYLLLIKKFKEAFTTEIKYFFMILIFFTTIICFNVRNLYDTIGDTILDVLFTTSSLMSSTGFSTADFDKWPELSRSLLITIMSVGACAGSTGGGIKVSRIVILFKGLKKELEGIVHPKQVKKLIMDSRPVEHEVVRAVNVYMISYLIIYVISVIIISVDGHDFITNFTAIAAMMNNTGPGLAMVGPTQNFGFFSAVSKIVLIFDMLAGRLELFPMLILVSPALWKSKI